MIKIYYPLPHSSAVVIFGDKQVAKEVLNGDHQISGSSVDISPLPRSVYRRVVTEVQKDVSDFLNLNPQLVDELQFIGEVNVNFNSEKERYFLDGTWYQLEWALHYLDTMLEAFQFESNDSDISRQQSSSPRPANSREMQSRGQQIKRPNIPAVRPPTQGNQSPSHPPQTGSRMSNFEKFSSSQSVQTGKPNKNKNAALAGVSAGAQGSVERKIYGETVRSNLDEDKYSIPPGATKNQFGSRPGNEWRSNNPSYGDDSDSENEAQLAAAYDRKAAFSQGTNFDQNKRRPNVQVPRMTKGIDVAQTDFGEVPLSFTFDLPGDLKIYVAYDDVTKQATDTIVNPTTADLSNVYGVSRAITAAAGKEMQQACNRFVEENGRLDCADVMHTVGGGVLSDKMGYVLHAVGPHWREEQSEESIHLLVCTYINCFQYADEKLWVKSLATPLISAGAFGFPLDSCIGAFFDAVLMFSTRTATKRHLKEIRLVCFDQDSAMATIMIVQSLLDCDKSQATVSATDRYWLRSQKYNFQSKYYKLSRDQDESEDEDSDDESEHKPSDEKNVNKYERKDNSVAAIDDEDDNDDDKLMSGDEDKNVKRNTADIEKVSAETKPETTEGRKWDKNNFEESESDEEKAGNIATYQKEQERHRDSETEESYPGETGRMSPHQRLSERRSESDTDEAFTVNRMGEKDDSTGDHNNSEHESEEIGYNKKAEANSLEHENADWTKREPMVSEMSRDAHADEEVECSDKEKEESTSILTSSGEHKDQFNKSQGKTSLESSGWSIVPGSDVKTSFSGHDLTEDAHLSDEENAGIEKEGVEKEANEENEEEEGLFL